MSFFVCLFVNPRQGTEEETVAWEQSLLRGSADAVGAELGGKSGRTPPVCVQPLGSGGNWTAVCAGSSRRAGEHGGRAP